MKRFLLAALLFLLIVNVATAQNATCTVADDCSNHAESVTTLDAGGCQCKCSNQWQGDQCQLCPTNFDSTKDCNACAPGYIGTFPNCIITDCTQSDCNMKAVNISGSKATGCVCQCRNQWTGDTCETCPVGVDSATDCSSCAAAYDGYPSCSLRCTVPANCSNHATAVNGTSATGCNCTCRNAYTGDSCETCPPEFDANTDCGTCALGYGGYPNCVVQCTNTKDCNGHALTVTGTPSTGCNCSCRNAWMGDKCEECPPLVEKRQDCGACVKGYTNYPNCVRGCSNTQNCSGHATSVVGNELVGCNCSCRNAWTGQNCSSCPNGVDASADCGTCLPRHGGYPNCQPICIASDCSDHASSIDGNPTTGCICNCRNSWNGTTCDSCPPLYNSAQDCGSCFPGFGPYPICNRSCTVEKDCNNNAGSAAGFYPNCTCNCANKWVGDTCDTCPHPFNGTHCSTCVDGYNGYPQCAVACTMNNCSAGAKSVSGNAIKGCTCTCNNSWYGEKCDLCPYEFDENQDCASCSEAHGYLGTYPNCYTMCTNANCSNNAANVSGTSATGCKCTCRNKWSGGTCNYCSSLFNKSEDCGACISGYDGYPSCSPLCTSSRNCYDHASNVTGTDATGCNCTCRNEWYGSSCQSCPSLIDKTKDCGECVSGATGYPDCVRNCSSSLDCNNRALSVVGTSATGCNCTCRNNWTGTTCASCPTMYDRNQDCGACSSLYGGDYPNCILKCTNADCSHHSVSQTGVKGNCTCKCKNRWQGDKCETCPTGFDPTKDCGACDTGYNGYPNCGVECTVNGDCYGNSNSVSGNHLIGCTCPCRNKWSLDNCSVCPKGYNATLDCGACATNYSGYPKCTRMCTIDQDCGPNAESVTGDFASGCKCHCRNQWSGERCEACPQGVNASDDCGSCADGFSGYAQCARSCTNEANCSGRASSVSGNSITGCVCNCNNSWFGEECQFCNSLYDSSKDCATCADPNVDNYPRCTSSCSTATCSKPGDLPYLNGTGCTCGTYCATHYIEWPECYLDGNCTNELDCSGRGTNVSGTRRTGCICNCNNSWTGQQCEICPAKFDVDKDCIGCNEPSWVGTYPDQCLRSCNVIDNCSSNAWQVEGNKSVGCNCSCKNAWAGDDCSVCPAGVNPVTSCSSCLSGYEFYPDCFLKCTVESNCTSSTHATSVSGNTNTDCKCTCSGQFFGKNCSQCPEGYRQSDCAACAPGWSGYPQCSPLCTNSSNCTDNAAAVSGTWRTGCKCTCRNQWEFGNCSYCPEQYNTSLDCGECRDGFFGYPNCVRRCRLDHDCSDHAHNVTGNGKIGCKCACRNKWQGSNCGVCPVGYDANSTSSSDCDGCADGYFGYPNCVRQCTINDDCTGHASNVSGNGDIGCNCTCSDQWFGTKCESCAIKFDQGTCDRCAHNYSGTYPACYRNCNSKMDCSSNAESVTGNVNTTCNCTCRKSWTGPKCDICPLGIDPAFDCGACKSGYTGYPNCRRECSVLADCTGQAESVTGYVSTTSSTCNCTCRNGWAGKACDFCPDEYAAQNDCGVCSSSYSGAFPTCYKRCTVPANCSGHALAVVGTTLTGCNCTCNDMWKGNTCATCPSPYDADRQCKDCLDGYGGYPACERNCNLTDCSNNANSVSGDIGTGCNCTCRHQWTGNNCSVCPEGFNQTDDCGSCSAGFSGYPKCGRQCTNSDDCNDHAKTITGNTFTGCHCDCRNAWSGDTCDTCPAGTNITIDCGACLPGFINYPDCAQECTKQQNCSNHAVTVSGTSETGCNCTCQNQWKGADCSICPDGVDPAANCGACLPDYDGYPHCSRQCFLSDCSFHATAVSGDTASGCKCSCRGGWEGKNCSVCPSKYDPDFDCSQCRQGYFGYPACYRPCLVYDDCSNHASDVSGNSPNCTCSCRNQWSGSSCNACPFPFGGYDCNDCQSGYAGYPNCDVACTNQGNCSNHASTVTGTYSSGCFCNCRNKWTGNSCQSCPPQYDPNFDCATCAPGYEGLFPNCYLKCTVTANCSGNAARAAGNTNSPGGCYCECLRRWHGKSCSECDARYNDTTCGGCAAGFEDYPRCTPIPTPAPPIPTKTPTLSEVRNSSTKEASLTHTPTPSIVADPTTSESSTITTTVTTTSTLTATNNKPDVNTPTSTASRSVSTDQLRSTTASDHTSATSSKTRSATLITLPVPNPDPPSQHSGTHSAEGLSSPTATVIVEPVPNVTNAPTREPKTPTSTLKLSDSTKTQDITNAAESSVSSTVVQEATPDPSTLAPHQTITCDVRSDCNDNAASVSVAFNTSDGTSYCKCACANLWTGAQCTGCAAHFNASENCGKCASGFEYYPRCACVYGVSAALIIESLDKKSHPTTATLVSHLGTDIASAINKQCPPNKFNVTGYIIGIDDDPNWASKKTTRIAAVATQDMCGQAQAAAECAAVALSTCIPLTKTNEEERVWECENSTAVVSRFSSCGSTTDGVFTGCAAAAEDFLLTLVTPAPVGDAEDEDEFHWYYVAIPVGCVVLLLLFLFGRRLTHRGGGSSFFFSEASRFNKMFNQENAKQEGQLTEFQYQLMGGEDIGSGMVEELMMLKNRNAPPGSPTPKKLPADSSNVVVAPEGPSDVKMQGGREGEAGNDKWSMLDSEDERGSGSDESMDLDALMGKPPAQPPVKDTPEPTTRDRRGYSFADI